VVVVVKWRDMGGKGAVVLFVGELADQLAVVDIALADADVHVCFGRVAKLDVIDVRHHFGEIASLAWAGDVVRWIEAEAQAFDVVAKHGRGVGVFGHAADLRFERDQAALERGDFNQFAQSLDFGVERCA